jgi:putative flippase GtrA
MGENFRQKLRFGLAGIVNTLVSYLAFVLIYRLSDNYMMASVLAYLVGVGVSYRLNRGFVFQSTASHKRFVAFCVINLTSLGCSTGTLYALVHHVGIYVYVAQVFAVGVSMVINYFGYRAVFQ